MSSDYKWDRAIMSQSPPLGHVLPLARLPFQPVTEAPRTVLPIGNWVFKHRSLGGTFLIQITSLCLLQLSDSLKSTFHRPPACLSLSDLGPKLSAHTSQWPCISAAQGDSICFLFTKYLLCVIFCRSPSLDVTYTHTENQLWVIVSPFKGSRNLWSLSRWEQE